MSDDAKAKEALASGSPQNYGGTSSPSAPPPPGYGQAQGGYQGGAPSQQGGYPPPQQGGYPPQQGGPPPQQGGYPPQQGGAPPQQGGYPPQQGGYPPQQGGYPPPQQGGYPPQQGGPPPQQGGYPPQQGGPPPQQGGYPPQQGGYPPPQQGGYPPQQGGYPPQQGGPPPQQGGYPPQQGGYPPPQGGYPPQGGAPQQGGYPPQQGGPGQPWKPGTGGQAGYVGEMPDQDIPEDQEGAPVAPSAPDISQFGKIGGYENVGFHGQGGPAPVFIPPPAYDEAAAMPKEPPAEKYAKAGQISEEEAREALLEYVSQHCCFGKGAANDLIYTEIKPSSALHYTLETFTEGRTTAWHFDPYSGQPVDGPQNGQAPPPWSIPCQAQALFNTETRFIEIPHTASVKSCHTCNGSGWLRCHSCLGRGTKKCSSCHGKGYKYHQVDGKRRKRNCIRCSHSGQPCHHCRACGWLRCHSCYGRGFRRCISCHGSGHSWRTDANGHRERRSCFSCHGTGRKRCMTCHGDGRVVCTCCNGYTQLKHYIRLTVQYTNNNEDHIVERTDFPDHLVKDVGGVVVFEQALPRVWPLSAFPDRDVCNGSQAIVSKHGQCFTNARILMQRQRLRAVPISECAYIYKGKDLRYWVYGNEHKVYDTDYPQQCCCGCTIL